MSCPALATGTEQLIVITDDTQFDLKLDTYVRTSGTKVAISCYNGNVLNGASSLTCQSNGEWNAAIPTCAATAVTTAPDTLTQDQIIIIGVACGLGVLILMVLILILILALRKVEKNKQHLDSESIVVTAGPPLPPRNQEDYIPAATYGVWTSGRKMSGAPIKPHESPIPSKQHRSSRVHDDHSASKHGHSSGKNNRYDKSYKMENRHGRQEPRHHSRHYDSQKRQSIGVGSYYSDAPSSSRPADKRSKRYPPPPRYEEYPQTNPAYDTDSDSEYNQKNDYHKRSRQNYPPNYSSWHKSFEGGNEYPSVALPRLQSNQNSRDNVARDTGSKGHFYR